MADITIPGAGITDNNNEPENNTQANNSVRTPAEMLKEVNNAIYSIMVGGQAYSIGSRSLTRANLAELRSLKNELEAEATRPEPCSTLFGDTYVAFFDGR